MDENLIHELKQSMIVIQELGERTGGINLRCKKILEIMNNPVKFILEGEKLEELINGIMAEFYILGSFADALGKMYKKEEENDA